MFRQIHNSLRSKILPIQRHYYSYGESSAITHSMFRSNLDDCASSHVASEHTVRNNFTSINIDATKAIAKARNNEDNSSDKIKVINVSLLQTPKLLLQFNKCNVLGDVIFSLVQVSDTLLSFLFASGGDISHVAEVFCLLTEIKTALSSDMAFGIIACILDDRHMDICLDLLNKFGVNTDGKVFELFCCSGYLLLLNKYLNQKFINNFIDIISKKNDMISKECDKSSADSGDSSFSNRMLRGAVDLLTKILECWDDDCNKDFCLLVVSRLYDLTSNGILNTWYTLDRNFIQCYLYLLVKWLDKINNRYNEFICKSKEVLLVRQGGYSDLTSGTNYDDLKIGGNTLTDGWDTDACSLKTRENDHDARTTCQALERYCFTILKQCVTIGGIIGRDIYNKLKLSNENVLLCAVMEFMMNVLNQILGDLGELISDKFYLQLVDFLLEKLGTGLKYVIQVNGTGGVKVKDIQVESIINHVSDCVKHVSHQMDDINCAKCVKHSIYQKLDVCINLVQSYSIFYKVKLVRRQNSLLKCYPKTITTPRSFSGSPKALADSKPPRARLCAATALIFGSSDDDDDSAANVKDTSHKNTMAYKWLSFGDAKKSVKSAMGRNQFIAIYFEEIVYLSSIQASVQFKNKNDCNNNKYNRLEYYNQKTNEFLTLKTFDISNGKLCYPGNNIHLWLSNTNITTNKLRFITDNGLVSMSFLKID